MSPVNTDYEFVFTRNNSRQPKMVIDSNEFPNGVYVVQVADKNQLASEKLILK